METQCFSNKRAAGEMNVPGLILVVTKNGITFQTLSVSASSLLSRTFSHSPVKLLIFLTFCLNFACAKSPNIVFIFADDWGWGDLSCHGHPYVKRPPRQGRHRLYPLHRRQRSLLSQPHCRHDRTFPRSLQHRRPLRLGSLQCQTMALP